MIAKFSVVAVLSFSVAAFPMQQARAQDGIVGGIIGGIIGGAIANGQRSSQPQRVVRSSGVSSAQREQNRSVQTALNHFGWNVGGADGVLGRRSREGISQYQVFAGFSGTGTLSDFERNILLTAHQRAIMGGPQVAQTVSSHPQGMRGMILVVRDEMSGRSPARSAGNYGLPGPVAAAVDEIAASSDPNAEQLVQRAGFVQLADMNGDGRTDYILDTSVTGSAFWCSAQACTVQAFLSTPDGYVRNDFQAFNVTPAMFTCTRGTCELNDTNAPVSVAAPAAPEQPSPTTEVALSVPSAQPAARNPGTQAAGTAEVPNFFGGGQATRSLASHCNKVNLLTSANGGFTTLETMNDRAVVIAEQFCLARTYAMADGETLIAKVQGATPDQIAAQCAGFAPSLQPHVSALSVKPRDEVMRDVGAFILQTGMNPEQLGATARICLAVGYKQDDMVLAIGSGLLLVAMGERAYGELMGHHLTEGFGATQRDDLSLAWYEFGLDPAKTAVFAPMQPERDDLLRAAVFEPESGEAEKAGSTALPVFSLQ
ncbi:MAG: putative peptidoglycan binding domain [Roseibaca calidilacus]|uniref:Peptidoglycan binding domain-containing protein n=1 Tax=Roseibaca calidilacus TaxID=1666912 RepID=A0A0P7VYT3_9RHOB|nr:peptidoglycan-binding domain-containing protein [Roseibaca calidilacus]KPP92642.1 MAG: putative peptidoglycan binding domain [Roseibaca calidilacus]CUX80286.1 Putative peptidoglycan binding domain-containing protein [Roseibaca calidilacus]